MQKKNTPRSLEGPYRAIIEQLDLLDIFVARLRSRREPSNKWPALMSLIRAEVISEAQGRPGEGLRLWRKQFLEKLDELPAELKARLDPLTNEVVRTALECRYVSEKGYAVSLWGEPATVQISEDPKRAIVREARRLLGTEDEPPQPSNLLATLPAKWPEIEAARALIQRTLIPHLIPDYARSLIPAWMRDRSEESVRKLLEAGLEEYRPPYDLHEKNFPKLVADKFALMTGAPCELLSTMVKEGKFMRQEISYRRKPSERLRGEDLRKSWFYLPPGVLPTESEGDDRPRESPVLTQSNEAGRHLPEMIGTRRSRLWRWVNSKGSTIYRITVEAFCKAVLEFFSQR